MNLFVSVLFNREDSKIIGIYETLTAAVKQTFIYLVDEEFLDYFNPEENEEKEEITNIEFLKLLEEETENWNLSKLDTVCKKYNESYDNENMFVMIEEKTKS